MAFAMSFLSVIILLALYQIFLGKLQVDSIKIGMGVEEVSTQMLQLVNLWLIGGLSTVCCMSGTLGVYSVLIKDREYNISQDLTISGFPQWQLELSYVIAAVLLGLIVAIVSCFAGLLIFNGLSIFELLSVMMVLKIIGLLFLGCLISSALVLPILSLIRTVSAFSALSAIVGTMIGFLSGVYISIGAVSDFLAQVMTWFPLTQINALLKALLMEQSINAVFAGAPLEVVDAYKEGYGITLFTPSGHMLSEVEMLLYITVCTGCLLALYLALKKGRAVLVRRT